MLDRLAGRPGPLEGQRHQGVVVELPLAVDQLAAAAGGGLAHRDLVLVHQADDGVGPSGLGDLAVDPVVLPPLDVDHRAGRMLAARRSGAAWA